MKIINIFVTRKEDKVEIRIRGILLVDKNSSMLQVGEGTHPRQSGRFDGVSIGRDRRGYFVFTHRARSKSYVSRGKIPNNIIRYIKSTG